MIPHHPDLYDVEVQWLRQDLAAHTKKWTVVPHAS